MRLAQIVEKIAVHTILIIAVILAMIPMLWIIVAAFQPNDRLFQYPPNWLPSLYLDNFTSVLARTHLPQWLINSSVVAVSTALATALAGAMAAYAFARFQFRGRNALLYAVLATQMIPGLTNIIPLYIMIQSVSATDSLGWLIITYTASALPLAIWMLTSFFQAIPRELEEAALMDGCTLMGAFWRVVLPLMLPGLAAVAILVFVIAWNEFVIALTFISTSGLKTYQLGLYDFLTTDAQIFLRYGYLHAAAAIGLVPTFIGYMLVQRYFISGLTAGAVKG
jgi:ABC-type glycerol-3-phosphate transport system permease component